MILRNALVNMPTGAVASAAERQLDVGSIIGNGKLDAVRRHNSAMVEVWWWAAPEVDEFGLEPRT